MLSDGMTIALTLMAYDKMSKVIGNAVNSSSKDFDKLQEKIKKVNQSTKEIGEGFLTAGGMMAGAGGAIAFAMAKPIQAFSQLEDAQVNLKTTMIDSSGHISKSFYEIDRMAKQLGQNLPGTTADFYNMASSLKALGITDKSLTGSVMQSAAYLGVALHRFGVDYNQAAEYAAKFKTALNISDKDMMGFMDVIQRTAYMGVKTEEMKEAFSHVSGALANFGTTGLKAAKDLTPLLTMLIKTGVRGEHAGTGIARMFQRAYDIKRHIDNPRGIKLTADEKTFASTLNFADSNGNWGGTQNFITQLQKLQKLNQRQRTDVLEAMFQGGDFVNMAAKISQMGMKGYNQIQAQMNNQANLETKAKMQLDKLSETWNKFTTTLATSLGYIAGSIGPEIIGLLNKFNSWAGKLGNWAEKHKLLAKTIMLTTTALSGTLIVLGGLQLVVGASLTGIDKMTEFYGNLFTEAKNLTPALRENCIQLLKVIGLNSTAHNLEFGSKIKMAGNPLGIDLKNFSLPSGISADLGRINNNLKSGIVNTFKELPNNIAKASIGLKGWTVNARSAAPSTFINGLKCLGTGYINLHKGVFQAIKSFMLFNVTLLASPITWIAIGIGAAALLIYKYWKPITGFFKGVWQGIKIAMAPVMPQIHAIGKALNPLLIPLKAVWNWFKNLIKPVDDVGGKAQSMGVKVGKVIGTIISKIVELINWIGKVAIKASPLYWLFKGGQWVFKVMGDNKTQVVNPKTIPHHAAGTNYAPGGLSLVGENGPELVNLTRGSQVFNAQETRNMLNRKSGSSSSIVIEYKPVINMPGASVQDKQDILKILKQHAQDLKRIVDGAGERKAAGAY